MFCLVRITASIVILRLLPMVDRSDRSIPDKMQLTACLVFLHELVWGLMPWFNPPASLTDTAVIATSLNSILLGLAIAGAASLKIYLHGIAGLALPVVFAAWSFSEERAFSIVIIFAAAAATTSLFFAAFKMIHDALVAQVRNESLLVELDKQQRWLEASNATLEHQARIDPVTGLPNRSQLKFYYGELCKEDPGTPIAIMFIDLDFFKPINDAHGHAIGDAVLAIAARRWLNALRPSDLLCRLGGDEFVAILRGVRDPKAATSLSRRLIDAIEQPITVPGARQTISLTCSIGVVLGSVDDPVDSLIAAADKAMFEAKRGGRAQLRLGLVS